MGENFDPAQPVPPPAELRPRKWVSTGLAWTILCVAPHMERKVAAALGPKSRENPHGVGLQVYVPAETYLPKTANVARSHRPWRPRTRALIPGVIFALLPDDRALDLARGNHAVRRVMCRDDGRPVAVPSIEIATLIWFEAWGLFDSTKRVSGARKGRRRGKRGSGEFESRWKHGQRVKIAEGAFAGFIGTIMRTDREDRLSVLISIFGRETPVELDESEIEGEGEA